MEFTTTEIWPPSQEQKVESIKHHRYATSEDIIHAISIKWKGKAKEWIIIEDIYESIELGHSQQEIIDTLEYLFSKKINIKKRLWIITRLISYHKSFEEFQKSISHKENLTKVFDIIDKLEKILIRYKNRESNKENTILQQMRTVKPIESWLEIKNINGLISLREHKVRENQTLTLQNFNYKDFSPIDTYYAIYTIMQHVIHANESYKKKYDNFFAYLNWEKSNYKNINFWEIIDEITFVIKNKKGIRY